MNRLITRKINKTTITTALACVMTLSVPMTAILSTQAATAKSSTAADNVTAAKRLNNLLKDTKSMTANFTQKTVGGQMSGSLKGSMSVQRPNNFRWETTSPSEQLIVANDETMWIYDKDLEQATKQSVSDQIGNTPALLLSGDYQKIAENFTITQPYAGKNYYKLLPKSTSANFKSMTLSFSGGKPVMMVLNDNLGQTTSIKFTNIKLNPTISASQFRFTPPKGVDVID